MQRHQRDPIGSGVLAVGIAGERCGRQKTLEVTLVVFLLILQSSVHQLLEVATPFLGLIGAIGDQLADVTAFLHHLLNQFRRRDGLDLLLQIVDQFAELQQSLGGATAQGAHRFGVTHHIPQGNTELIGRVGEPLNRGLADAALGHIDHPQQADGVCRVDQQPQISQQILDLPPVVEAQTPTTM